MYMADLKNGIAQYLWHHKSRATLIKLQNYWLIDFKTLQLAFVLNISLINGEKL